MTKPTPVEGCDKPAIALTFVPTSSGALERGADAKHSVSADPDQPTLSPESTQPPKPPIFTGANYLPYRSLPEGLHLLVAGLHQPRRHTPPP